MTSVVINPVATDAREFLASCRTLIDDQLDRLVYYEQFSDAISAITREKEIKSWRREKKNKLVRALNPKWQDLAEKLFGENIKSVTCHPELRRR